MRRYHTTQTPPSAVPTDQPIVSSRILKTTVRIDFRGFHICRYFEDEIEAIRWATHRVKFTPLISFRCKVAPSPQRED